MLWEEGRRMALVNSTFKGLEMEVHDLRQKKKKKNQGSNGLSDLQGSAGGKRETGRVWDLNPGIWARRDQLL